MPQRVWLCTNTHREQARVAVFVKVLRSFSHTRYLAYRAKRYKAHNLAHETCRAQAIPFFAIRIVGYVDF
ncbi:MAG: hypothetical protein EAZ20_01825 [Bacteroidetes bacterium]|nr:MAG: hypothetical protein EAZ20_01825 [Bacteroidota bacterium]